jgi:hypothetical protein
LLVAVHDVDSRRDLVGAVVAESRRARFDERRPAAGPREAEVVDFSGAQRELVVDFLAGALRMPVATEPFPMRFAADSYWRGELHHLCDSPGTRRTASGGDCRHRRGTSHRGQSRTGAGGATWTAPEAGQPAGPDRRAGPISGDRRCRRRLRARGAKFCGYVRDSADPQPIGPFDFVGVYDEASDRHRRVTELVQQGHEDAYRAFIDPYVAAGERVEIL